MLSEREKILLTAYVDGELNTRQRRYLARLLHRSPEARQLLQQLWLDARRLRQLEPPPLPADLSGAILQEISRRELKPAVRHRPTLSEAASVTGHVPTWLGLVSAAAVLLLVGAVSYIFFAHGLNPGVKPPEIVARKESLPGSPTPRQDTPQPRAPEFAPPPEAPTPLLPDPPSLPEMTPEPGVIVKEPDQPLVSPERPEEREPRPGEAILADKPREELALQIIEALPPTLIGMHGLEDPSEKDSLRDLLGKSRGFRIEIPCKDGSQTLRLLQEVCQGQGIELILEPFAKTRLTRSQWRTSYLLYLDTLTPDEAASLLAGLGSKDRTRAQRRPSERQTTQAVVTPLSRLDVRELVDHTGTDLTHPPEPELRGPLGTNLKKPLSEQTARDVARALDGKGRKGEAAPPSTAPPSTAPPSSATHVALGMVYNLARVSPPQAEVQRFLEQNKPPSPETVRILLILRSIG